MTVEESDRLKQSYDSLGDKAYAILACISEEQKAKEQAVLTGDSGTVLEDKGSAIDSTPEIPAPSGSQQGKSKAKRDLYALLRDNYSSDSILEELWVQCNTVPEWVDWEQIARGQEVFYRYGGPALMGLAFQSLLGGMGAGRVVEVCQFLSRVQTYQID